MQEDAEESGGKTDRAIHNERVAEALHAFADSFSLRVRAVLAVEDIHHQRGQEVAAQDGGGICVEVRKGQGGETETLTDEAVVRCDELLSEDVCDIDGDKGGGGAEEEAHEEQTGRQEGRGADREHQLHATHT